MWCAMCYNSSCGAFIAGLAETRTNRQNYLRAVARCSHSRGDLQTSFSVHASQWWSLFNGARSAHTEVLRSRGKTFWMLTATESVHKILFLKLKSRYHPLSLLKVAVGVVKGNVCEISMFLLRKQNTIWGFFPSRSPSEDGCQGKGLFQGEP